jgi:hypothetical protein
VEVGGAGAEAGRVASREEMHVEEVRRVRKEPRGEGRRHDG